MKSFLYLKEKNISDRWLAIFVIAFGVVFASLWLWRQWERPTLIVVGGEIFEAQVVATPALREKGLSGRKSLAKNEGMLFIFPSVSRYAFWMKDMNFSIDLIWIKDGKIVDIVTRLPPALTKIDAEIPRYWPRLGVDRVLEVVAGTVDRLKLKIGDEIKMPDR